mmetsp:Transcript_7401/g.10369  ORF Transcript_7401/g.10369 Transcript_7401/m.10369 type:complete len:111 (-) Transcript_7401:13-345(-)
MQILPCLISASLKKSREMKLENPRGSNPTSPGRVPSNFSGFGMKGIDFDFSDIIATLEDEATDFATRLPVKEEGAVKADAPVRRAATDKILAIILKSQVNEFTAIMPLKF